MNNIQTTRILATVAAVSALGAFAYMKLRPHDGSAATDNGSSSLTTGHAHQAVMSQTAPGTPLSDSPTAATNLGERPKRTLPEGMDPVMWKNASAIATLLAASNDNTLFGLGDVLKPESAEKLRDAIGLSEENAAGFMDLINARNEESTKASQELMEKLLKNPDTLTEMIALSMMDGQGTLTPSQRERMESIEKSMEAEAMANASKLTPWYADDSFIDSAKATLPAEEATKLDDYVKQQRDTAQQAQTDATVQHLTDGLHLDDAQQQAVAEAYQANPNASDDAILPLLNEEQKAAYPKVKKSKASLSISASAQTR